MDNSRTLTAMLAGAVVGGVVGYLFFTDRGRQLRRSLEPALEDLSRELNSFRATMEKAAGVATDGWQMLNEAVEPGTRARRFPNAHQTSPF